MIGGSVLRTVGRAVAGSVSGSLSAARAAKPPTGVPMSASSSGATSPRASPSPAFASAEDASAWSSRSCLVDEEWERVGEEDALWHDDVVVDGAFSRCNFVERFVFAPAPSREEAEEAVSTLQQMLAPVDCSQVIGHESQVEDDEYDAVDEEISSVDAVHSDSASESSEGCQSDWIEPEMQLYRSNSSQSNEQEKVLHALHLFKTSTSLQRVVISISSDKAVWDAILNNPAIQELKQSLCEGASTGASDSNMMEKPDEAAANADLGLLAWIFRNAKAKIAEFIDKITKLANEIFPSQKIEMDTDEGFDDVVRSSLLISVMVFMLIIMKRLKKA
ncbi:hypothetical protein Cni_G18955 [Canna indica]|uniref:Uncharacterized protein n=1 Tax=Canna indica TaxID=4628 RepID=A0AAQ3QI38_9LILI|nr:hypothetical protein Cni_G18955 [Canna indica]